MMVSTPNGMNMFYKMWMDAVNKKNDYIPIEVHWSEVPGRDEDWKIQTIRNTYGEEQFQTEFECSFLGSSNTLIHAKKLGVLSHSTPITSNAGLRVYEKPNPEASYVITVDVSRGVANDYSAFVVMDVSELPYKQVAVYRDNEIKAYEFSNVIHKVHGI